MSGSPPAGAVGGQKTTPTLDYVQSVHIEDSPPLHTAVVGRNELEEGPPLAFWVSVALVAFAIGVVAAVGSRPWLPLSWVAWIAAIAAAAVVVIRRGRRQASISTWTLAWVDRSAGELRVHERGVFAEGLGTVRLPFEEVVEVLYALRDVPLPGARRNVNLLGAAVHVRCVDGDVWTVVPATHDREGAFAAASRLALRLGVGVKQVGAGWRTGSPVYGG